MGGEYTNYRRGAGRDKWEQEQKPKASVSGYVRAEDLVPLAAAK